MPYDAQVQLAPDGQGKKVDMDQVATQAGDTVYRQRATLVGETGNILQDLLREARTQTRILRAILATLQMANTGFGTTVPNVSCETDFDAEQGPNNE